MLLILEAGGLPKGQKIMQQFGSEPRMDVGAFRMLRVEGRGLCRLPRAGIALSLCSGSEVSSPVSHHRMDPRRRLSCQCTVHFGGPQIWFC